MTAKGKPTGRPSSYTATIGAEICERLAAGDSLAAICRDTGTPERTVYRWLAENEAFRQDYACAREAQAEADADRVGDIGGRVLTGELDPQAARVAIDAYKWSAGKRNPKKYGDRLALAGDAESPVKVDATVTMEPGEAYMRLLNPNA